MRMNLNDRVWVRLTPDGENAWKAHWEKFGILRDFWLPRSDRDGYHRFQVRELMAVFGPALSDGGPILFTDNEICLTKPE